MDLEEIFSQLHEKMAQQMLGRIDKAKESGEELPASFYKEVREFLKDNGIDLDVERAKKSPLKQLAKVLPFDTENN